MMSKKRKPFALDPVIQQLLDNGNCQLKND